MSDAQTTQDVRTAALDLLTQCGAQPDELLAEAIVIRDGHYIGRRFSRGSVSTLWLADSNTFHIVDSASQQAVCVPSPTAGSRRVEVPAVVSAQRAA